MRNNNKYNIIVLLYVMFLVATITLGCVALQKLAEISETMEVIATKMTEEEKEPEPDFVYGESKYVPTHPVEYNEENKKLLTERIAFECGPNASRREMFAVGATILNRVESLDYPYTLKEVLEQPGMYNSIEGATISDEALKNAEDVVYDLLWNNYRPLDVEIVVYLNRKWVETNGYNREPAFATANYYYYRLY